MTVMPPSVRLDPPGRGRIYDSILDTIGNTPLVRAQRLSDSEGVVAELLLKLEFFNPLASVKDRIALGMVIDLEQAGQIKPGETTLVEPTSGNTGIGLAFVAASRGYKIILTMPESMSIERRKMLALLGAQVELTPREKGMNGAIAKARELLETIPHSVMPSQFDNPSNPAIHDRTTAEEIWKDTAGEVDAIICGVGTGGTFTGCARTLKPRRPSLRMIAVEPEKSPVLSGGAPSPHPIQGIGAGFIPANMDTSYIDEIVKVSNERALDLARKIARLEGIAGGISSGAALAAAVDVGKRPEMAGKKIVVIIPSFAERYLSTALFEGIG
ncbi:MAG: cysteine synthase A [Alphaproteobacteria bacterium]|nr:cysteine synthase A [Alphaproteobacteria bacterium]